MKKICDDLEAEKKFCAGVLNDGIEDFYYDTRFKSFEEAYAWGLEHNCTHIYDNERDMFIKI